MSRECERRRDNRWNAIRDKFKERFPDTPFTSKGRGELGELWTTFMDDNNIQGVDFSDLESEYSQQTESSAGSLFGGMPAAITFGDEQESVKRTVIDRRFTHYADWEIENELERHADRKRRGIQTLRLPESKPFWDSDSLTLPEPVPGSHQSALSGHFTQWGRYDRSRGATPVPTGSDQDSILRVEEWLKTSEKITIIN